MGTRVLHRCGGGSATTLGLSCRGMSRDWWFYVPWGRKINAGVSFEGRRLSSKLSVLELVGPLICLAAAPDMVRGRPVRIWVDNIGSVKIWQKGYSIAGAALFARRWCR